MSILVDIIPPQARIPVTIGFLGGFTTFSTFSYETVRYMQSGAWGIAVINLLANVIICLAATWAGISLGQKVFGGV